MLAEIIDALQAKINFRQQQQVQGMGSQLEKSSELVSAALLERRIAQEFNQGKNNGNNKARATNQSTKDLLWDVCQGIK